MKGKASLMISCRGRWRRAANVQKENSNVRQTLRMLLLAVRTLLDAPPTPVSVPSSPMLSAVNYTPGTAHLRPVIFCGVAYR
jgi:hypothetical protein